MKLPIFPPTHSHSKRQEWLINFEKGKWNFSSAASGINLSSRPFPIFTNISSCHPGNREDAPSMGILYLHTSVAPAAAYLLTVLQKLLYPSVAISRSSLYSYYYSSQSYIKRSCRVQKIGSFGPLFGLRII